MVAYAEPRTQNLRPMDTGAIFNGNVRVWLFTDDALEAAACGRKLHELGLPRQLALIQRPSVQGMFAINPNVPPRYKPGVGNVPEFLHWRGRPMVLETQDPMDLMRFFKWLHAKNPEVQKAQKPASLQDLADAGEIETFDAG